MNKKIMILIIIIVIVVSAGSIYAIIKNKNNGVVVKVSNRIENVESKIDYFVLVNKQNKLPDDWESKVQLLDVKDAWGKNIKVEKEAYEKYMQLKFELEKQGVYIELDSCYRSVAEQQDLWDRWTIEKGIDYVKNYVAVPGYSEHHTGLALDICIRVDGELVYENDDMITYKEIFAKIHAKLAEYGFILRYPDGKDSITGYSYEPWHLRYIGSVDKAKEITSLGITLEEYLNK